MTQIQFLYWTMLQQPMEKLNLFQLSWNMKKWMKAKVLKPLLALLSCWMKLKLEICFSEKGNDIKVLFQKLESLQLCDLLTSHKQSSVLTFFLSAKLSESISAISLLLYINTLLIVPVLLLKTLNIRFSSFLV